MPNCDGFQATKLLRSWEREVSRKPVPVIAMTAYTMPEDQEQCLQGGMNDYISKPFSKEGLKDKVVKWLAYNAADGNTNDMIDSEV